MSHISHKITLPQCGVGAGTDAYACPIRKSQLEAMQTSPNVVHNNRRPTTNEPSMTEEQIVRVPDVLHAGWTKKDRERAEVACMCVSDGTDVRLACSKSRRKWHMDLQDMHSQR